MKSGARRPKQEEENSGTTTRTALLVDTTNRVDIMLICLSSAHAARANVMYERYCVPPPLATAAINVRMIA